jgi:hypothetical protein
MDMKISTKHGFAFLCMPKCASTSVETAIRKYCNVHFWGYPALKHIDAKDFHKYILAFHRKALPKVSIETFCIMREPIEWLHSWYKYRSRDELKEAAHPFRRNYTGDISFNQFVDSCLAGDDAPSYAKVGSQAEFVRLEDGTIGVDRIFRLERMEQVSEYLTEKVGEEITFSHRNQSPPRSLALDRSRRQRLMRYYSADYEVYESI